MPKKKSRKDPKTRILDVAEKVFAGHGYDATSMRAIAIGAGVNLPTIYYHFDSKVGVLQAVLDRRLDPLGQEHLALLAQAQVEAAGQPVPLEQVIRALLLPPLRLAATGCKTHAIVMQLIGRIMAESNVELQQQFMGRHREIKNAFFTVLARTLPELPEAVLRWRCEFAWGLLGAIMSGSRRIGKETAGLCNPLDTEAVLAEATAFLAAAFRAPAASPPTPS